MIKRRHVFHIAGYDPVRPLEQHQRFARQLRIFQRTWNVEATVSELNEQSCCPSWTVTAGGPDWSVDAIYELLSWDHIVRGNARTPELSRLLQAAKAYFNLFVTGTIFRYVKANARYGIFTLFPLLQIGLLAVCSLSAAWFFTSWWKLTALQETATVLLIGGALFFLLLKWPGRRWRIQQALDDWILSVDYIYGRRSDVEETLNRFAERLVACVREGNIDEIVVVGHSLGATFAIDVVARALDAEPNLGQRGISISVVTVGATIPKCALHPSGQRIRDRIAQILAEPSIHWAEFQARADAISFYRFDPARLQRIREKEDQINSKPVIRRVQIQNMLTRETFAKYRFRVLRLHYQFVMANDRRSTYDYFMLVCGPVAVKNWSMSKLGFLDHFEHPNDARITAPGARTPA